jgi:Alpha amylase, catalytic domain
MSSHPLVYEINTRCWLRELSERTGNPLTLANIPTGEFDRWQSLGFTHIWLMGVWSSGPLARRQALANPELKRVYSEILPGWQPADIAGSPYAIAAYDVPAQWGGEAGLAAFRRQLHARGMKLLLDFVPNHLGLDHPWLRTQPDLFVQSPNQISGVFPQATRHGRRWIAHGKDPYFSAWTDTAQLDYRRPATRLAVAHLLQTVAARCDGVRCDMAMLLLNDVFNQTWAHLRAPSADTRNEFWSSAIASVKAEHPNFLFLAEVYWGLESRLHELGFDYTYDKELYDQLVTMDAAALHRHLFALPPTALAAGAHFLENHDERRIAALLSREQHSAAAWLILSLPGMRLLHEGQLTGARLRVPVQLARRPAEPAAPGIAEIYHKLLGAIRASAIGQGRGELLPPRDAWPGNPTAQNFVLTQWQAQPLEFDLAVVNLAPHRSQCFAPLTVPELPNHTWLMKDLLGREEYMRPGLDLQQQGLYLDVPPHAAQLFHFQSEEKGVMG